MLTNAIQIQAFITSLLNSCNNFINNLHAISFSFLQTIFSMLLSRFSRVRLCDPRWQPTRLTRPRDSPGKNTGVGCHFLLQCMKVKSESEVAQSCPTPSDLMDCSLPGSSVHGIFQARVLLISINTAQLLTLFIHFLWLPIA